MKEKGLLL